jgi:hypothetical protein
LNSTYDNTTAATSRPDPRLGRAGTLYQPGWRLAPDARAPDSPVPASRLCRSGRQHARGVSLCLRSRFQVGLGMDWPPHERCATDPQAVRDNASPSLRIPTRTGLTATDHIAEALTSNVRAPGADSFESAAQRHRQPGPHPSVPIPTRAGPYPPGPRRPLPVLSPITLGRSASATP